MSDLGGRLSMRLTIGSEFILNSRSGDEVIYFLLESWLMTLLVVLFV